MPVENVLDSAGNGMELYVYEKKPWHLGMAKFNHDMLENMPNYRLRDDDILLCSYPKSGCHWVWEVSRLLVSGRTSSDDVDKEQFQMEVSDVLGFGNIDDHPSPRLLTNHQFFDNQPQDLLTKGTKVILVYRNPKDVAVSLYYHIRRLPFFNYQADFLSFLPRFVDGLVESNCVFDYLHDWEQAILHRKDLNICVLCYEDLQANPLAEVKKLSTFLGKDYDATFLQAVIDATSIDVMREVKNKPFHDDAGSIVYRKGKVGDWKNHFTVAQSEWFDHVTRIRMRDTKLFKFKYELDE